MPSFPLFRYFFHRPAVAIGASDLAGLSHLYGFPGEHRPAFTQWLIGLLFHEGDDGKGWRVLVYPVEEGKAFWSYSPFFQSALFATYELAWGLSETIKTHTQHDRLTSVFLGIAE